MRVEVPFTAAVCRIEGALTATVGGELDMSTAPRLERCLDQALRESVAPEAITLDMRGVLFVDSVGLRVLLLAHRRCEEHGTPLRLAGTVDAVRRVFELSGVDHVIHVMSTGGVA